MWTTSALALATPAATHADAGLGEQFDVDVCRLVRGLQVEDQLLGGPRWVDVVQRRWRDEPTPGVDLRTWAIISLTFEPGGGRPRRASSLCHLDLQLVGVREVRRGDAKAARRHLFDVTLALGVEPLRRFAALAELDLAPSRFIAIELFSWASGGSPRLIAAVEPLDDVLDRLGVLDRDRIAIRLELE